MNIPGSNRVLIVDDEASLRGMLDKLLKSEGYETHVVASGQEALEQVLLREFQVVLLDIRMPGLSGLDVLEKLRVSHPNVAVIMVTAVANVQTALRSLRQGAYDYIVKPFELEEILVKVEKALERRRLVLQEAEYEHRMEQELREQRLQMQNQLKQLVRALAQEHAAVLKHVSKGRRRRRKDEAVEIPPELMSPKASVEEFAKALLHSLSSASS